MDKNHRVEPIGRIISEWSDLTGAPRQGRLTPEAPALLELFPDYEEGLEKIEQFSHLVIVYLLDRSTSWQALVVPPGQTEKRGVFASRSPFRPNPIGVGIVKLIKREGNCLHVRGTDAFTGTPLLDIKPYIPTIDSLAPDEETRYYDLGMNIGQ
jgi:tRNA (adenine37-N6)-methyltransferase